MRLTVTFRRFSATETYVVRFDLGGEEANRLEALRFARCNSSEIVSFEVA